MCCRPLPSAVRVAVVLVPCLALPCAADLLLNEVLYDPAGADEGHEFVELWNPDTAPVSLDGVAIEAGDGANPELWKTIWIGPAGASVSPASPFLVSAVDLTGAIQNGPDAVRLTRNGSPIDLLGYGDLESPLLYLGSPAPDAASGQSLARRLDGIGTGSNVADWEVSSDLSPGAANHPDERLRLSRAAALVDPEVTWPGERLALTARVRNTGRLPIAGDRWAFEVDLAEGADSIAGWNSVALAPGVAVASGDSVGMSLSIQAPAAGVYRVRGRIRALLADTVVAAIRSIADPAVVNEICFRDTGAGEWIELWLRGDIPDLGALSIADAHSVPRPIDRGAAPRSGKRGEILVVAEEPALVRGRFGLDASVVLGVSGTWPSLNDTDAGGIADRVRVLDASGAPVDAVPYRADATARGGTLERLSADLPSASAGAWTECVDPARATPGRPNSIRAPAARGSTSEALLVTGTRVVRRADSGSAPLVLRATAAARGRRLVVRVHDLLGRPKRTLVDGQRIAAEAAFVWDGRDDTGRGLAPGLYLLRAEAIAEDGLPGRVSQISVAVASEAGP